MMRIARRLILMGLVIACARPNQAQGQSVTVTVGPAVRGGARTATLLAQYPFNGRWALGYRCVVHDKGEAWRVLSCAETWVA